MLDDTASRLEDHASELGSAIGEPDTGEAAIDDVANAIDGQLRDLVDIYAYRESLRR